MPSTVDKRQITKYLRRPRVLRWCGCSLRLDMADEMISAYHKKGKSIRIPKPVNRNAILKSIRINGVTLARDALEVGILKAGTAKFKSRRSIARELRRTPNKSRNPASAAEEFLRSVNEEIENWQGNDSESDEACESNSESVD